LLGIVTLCGSTKFKDTFLLLNRELTMAGYVVLMPGVFLHREADPAMKERILASKEALDVLHKEKIVMSDVIVVVDVGKYIGDSTKSEIMFADNHNKPVFRFSDGSWKQLLGMRFT
jgi:hypothetical protein